MKPELNALSSTSSPPTIEPPTAEAALMSAAAPAPATAHPVPATKAAHVLFPAFRPRILALSNISKNDGKVLIKLPATSMSPLTCPAPQSFSSQLWQRHAHGSYRSYYGARRQASSTGIASAAAIIPSTTHLPPASRSPPPTDARLSLLQPEWFTGKDFLDIGTNTGKVAWEICLFFKPRRVVGVDIDPELIRVAQEKLAWASRREGGRNGFQERVEFRCEDFMGSSMRKRRGWGGDGEDCGGEDAAEEERVVEGREGKEDGKSDPGEFGEEQQNNEETKAEMEEKEKKEEKGVEGTEEYDIISCFSVTKHIHLQGGDAALRRLLHRVHARLRPGGRFILEPQAWRTYRKRRHASVESQKNYALLHLRPPFKEVLMNEVGFESVEDLGIPPKAPVGYRRPLYCFVKKREDGGERVERGQEGLEEGVREEVKKGVGEAGFEGGYSSTLEDGISGPVAP